MVPRTRGNLSLSQLTHSHKPRWPAAVVQHPQVCILKVAFVRCFCFSFCIRWYCVMRTLVLCLLCIDHAEVTFKAKDNKTTCKTLTADDKLQTQGHTHTNSTECSDYKLLQAKGLHCTAKACTEPETREARIATQIHTQKCAKHVLRSYIRLQICKCMAIHYCKTPQTTPLPHHWSAFTADQRTID